MQNEYMRNKNVKRRNEGIYRTNRNEKFTTRGKQ